MMKVLETLFYFGAFQLSHFRTFFGEVPEWPKGADCKSAGEAFGGSNPPLSTSEQIS
jgi:hypothetical protein